MSNYIFLNYLQFVTNGINSLYLVMIKLIKPYKGHEAGQIIGLGCVQEARLIKKGIAIKLKLPQKDYGTKS